MGQGVQAADTLSAAWRTIDHAAAIAKVRGIRALFAADPDRADRLICALDDLSLDFSKSAIDQDALAALLDLARAADVEGFRDRMFAGEMINLTEHRAALHVALRAPEGAGMTANTPAGREDASTYIERERQRMQRFVEAVHDGRIVGATGMPFDTVLNIGIGGSDLGPSMAAEALTLVGGAKLRARFLSNVDGHAFAALARDLDPARTLILVASKTFTTLETATNAHAARAWMVNALGASAVAAHFVALSTNAAATAEFGIVADRVFGFRDWVGGRYSVWSPIGLSVALAAGWQAFAAMLDGAHAMDEHFRTAGLSQNLPVLLALVGVWNANAMGYGTQCILAYDARLRRFPAYLQQLEMESNGKSVTLDGTPAARATCPVLFGEPGTDAQHSFIQLVHQGTQIVPVDFILAACPDHTRPDAHLILAANAFAQAAALLSGKDQATVAAEMQAAGATAAEVAAVAPHKQFSGDRPSNMILFRELNAFSLGRLIALYEHKVAVQGCIWQIDSFDQWGVELGKVLAANILPALRGAMADEALDAPMRSTVRRFKALRGA